jgi:hypothetical protein
MNEQDWPKAAGYLQPVYDQQPLRRGLTKSLGYTYTWLGEFDKAQQLLVLLPETRNELTVYTWWWNERMQRPDLSQNATALLRRIRESTP